MDRKSNAYSVTAAVLFTALALITNLISAILIIRKSEMVVDVKGNAWLGLIFNTLAFLFAIIYLLKGYKKENSVLFKLFSFSFCLALVIAACTSKDLDLSLPILQKLIIPSYVVMLISVIIVGFFKNLGKKSSLTIATINLVVPFILPVSILIFANDFISNGEVMNKMIFVSFIRMAILAFVMYIAVKSKYIDKELRGTN